MLRLAMSLVALLCGLVSLSAAARGGEHAYVLDSGAKLLVELDLETGKRAGSLPLEGTPGRLDDDGRYVLVLDPGPGEDKDERGWRASGRSSVTIVDAATLKAIRRVDRGPARRAGGRRPRDRTRGGAARARARPRLGRPQQ